MDYHHIYNLDTHKGIKRFLKDYYRINERRFYKGNYKASDTIIDLEMAIEEANLNYKQKKVLKIYFFEDKTQVEGAEELDIPRKTFSNYTNGIVKRLHKVFKGWEIKEARLMKETIKENN